eukprot:CAMPEP_0195322868 /NCGR_PEP_ID=MMETSP0708-20121125/7574_1 /TAXON_ID=33640 /ORGANISM="Asterionellopsis glacialis, Strain CCMP134" /LENGTH=38 /DNA_ID= /DNA_START= /DNA_END= /DNA_ORIENTATION=
MHPLYPPTSHVSSSSYYYHHVPPPPPVHVPLVRGIIED